MTSVDNPEAHGLTRVGGRPPFGVYLRDVLKRRDFILSLARFRIEAENQRNRLGLGWVVLKPLLNAAVFGLVFGILMQSGRTPQFLEFLLIGVFMFEFFGSCLASGAKAITSNSSLVQSLAFPRMSLPISVVTQRFLQLIPALALMIAIVAVMGNRPTWNWFLIVPLVALYYVFNLGVVLIVARLTVHLRDLANLIPFATRLVFYTTGVFFSFELRFADHPTLVRIMDFQPIHVFLALARQLMLDGDPMYDVHQEYWLTLAVWSVAVLAVGMVFFWAAEERYGRVD